MSRETVASQMCSRWDPIFLLSETPIWTRKGPQSTTSETDFPGQPQRPGENKMSLLVAYGVLILIMYSPVSVCFFNNNGNGNRSISDLHMLVKTEYTLVTLWIC